MWHWTSFLNFLRLGFLSTQGVNWPPSFPEPQGLAHHAFLCINITSPSLSLCISQVLQRNRTSVHVYVRLMSMSWLKSDSCRAAPQVGNSASSSWNRIYSSLRNVKFCFEGLSTVAWSPCVGSRGEKPCLWQGLGSRSRRTQKHPDFQDRSTHKGVRTSGGFSRPPHNPLPGLCPFIFWWLVFFYVP